MKIFSKLANKLTISSVLLTLLISIPALILFSNIFSSSENWQHLVDTVLFEYIFNSLYIMFGVGILTAVFRFYNSLYHFTFLLLQVQDFFTML